jgi:hypothetical protein
MKTFRGLVASLVVALGGATYAADSPLAQISQDADVVIRIRQFDGTVEKVAALVNAVQPGFGDMVSQNAPAFGLVLSNPGMAGVDRSKDFYLCLFMREEGEPKALFAIPTTDGEALSKALPGNFEAQVRDDWVFYADKDHGVPEVAGENDSLATVLEGDSQAAKVFANSDIGLHVNIDHIAAIYDSKLQQGREIFETQLQQGLNAPGVANPEAVVGILKAEVELAFKLLDETDALTMGLSPSAEQLQIDHLLEFAEGSDVAKFIASQPKSEFPGITKLAAGLPVYVGLSGDMIQVSELSMQLVGSMFEGTGMKEGMDKYVEVLKKHDMHSGVAAFDLAGGEQGLIRSSILFETKGASDLLTASRSFYETMKEMKVGEVTTKMEVAEAAETIGTRKVDVITTTQEVDASSPSAQMVTKMNTILYGANGIQTRIVSLADGLLMTQGGDKGSMEAALTAYDSSTNTLDDVRKDLPDEAHLLVLLDLPGLIANGMLAATTIPDAPVPFSQETVEALEISRSYLTVTAVGGEESMHVTTRIPAAQFQGIMKMVMFAQSFRGQ